ncbi:MAG: SDR family oxidoreductase [Leptospiraceae bacterium]|nr:SDR family oxidoreductase [Leptospiraceae bacterium]MCP5513410.1 SDR family oxidoreductase [Leptospiraceae bacterium]
MISPDEIRNCIEVLQKINENPDLYAGLELDDRVALLKECGKISRPDKDLMNARNRLIRKEKKKSIFQYEKIARSKTGIREARKSPVFQAPALLTDPSQASIEEELSSPRNCYVCKKEYRKLHFFYDSMCTECGDFNYAKRFQKVSLDGRIALITGSRLKIGYHTSLMLLRSGAEVIATTRFPVDSAYRFSKEEDFNEWKDRLHIYGLDLRHTPSVELFAIYVENHYPRLDILINNAAQTVRRPSGFYAHLMPLELKPLREHPTEIRNLLSHHNHCIEDIDKISNELISGNEPALPITWNSKLPGMGLRSSAVLSQIPYSHDDKLPVEKIFPAGQLDADLQQVDLRTVNSWRLKLGEIPIAEMIEIQLINAIAPFVLNNYLVKMMRRDFTGEKHIINVSAMEGKFHRFTKIDRHPHTNMAKAALNMLTHTSASDLAKDGIFMNAVDTGWVTDEDPVHLSRSKEEIHDFQPPLDIVDGAARVCDPLFHGILTGEHVWGKFLKDYKPIDW